MLYRYQVAVFSARPSYNSYTLIFDLASGGPAGGSSGGVFKDLDLLSATRYGAAARLSSFVFSYYVLDNSELSLMEILFNWQPNQLCYQTKNLKGKKKFVSNYP
jgi:hypothetical protein